MSEIVGRRIASPWRIVGWGTAVLLLAAPFVAMQLHAQGVDWSPGDFIFAGVIFAVVGGLLELAVWKIKSGWYRAAVAVALLANLLVVWVNLAVGLVGSEHNPFNQLFFVALLVGIVAACVVRFRAREMTRAMLTAGVSLLIAYAIASMGGTDEPYVKHGVELAGTSFFAALFFVSAWLFRHAIPPRERSSWGGKPSNGDSMVEGP
ncbi:MAG TPA: hypothetical protein VFW39_01985 [Sphingomicrobium sp.]|nr:hypothetical protein [Sphingomicrobium sp.]